MVLVGLPLLCVCVPGGATHLLCDARDGFMCGGDGMDDVKYLKGRLQMEGAACERVGSAGRVHGISTSEG
jgi:hypothetical protein